MTVAQDDWTTSETARDFERIYSTTFVDRVTNARIEAFTLPAYVTATYLPGIAVVGDARPSDTDASSGSDVNAGELTQFAVALFGGTASEWQVRAANKSKTSKASAASSGREITEQFALDMILGRELHRAAREQITAPTVPAENSPPEVYSLVDLISSGAMGSIVAGVGGLFIGGGGMLVGVALNRAGGSLADELADGAKRAIRSRTDLGQTQNENEQLSLENENLRLKAENAELRKKARRS